MNKKEFGQRVRDIRNKMGLSQLDFAMLCEMQSGHVAQLEHGIHNVTLETLNKISNGAGIPLSDLLCEDMPELGEKTENESKLLAYFRRIPSHAQETAVGIVKLLTKIQ